MDLLPSTREIDRARSCLRQAYEIATMLQGMECVDAPEARVDLQRRQFLFQMEQAASRMGFEFKRPGSVPAIDNTEPNTMGR